MFGRILSLLAVAALVVTPVFADPPSESQQALHDLAVAKSTNCDGAQGMAQTNASLAALTLEDANLMRAFCVSAGATDNDLIPGDALSSNGDPCLSAGLVFIGYAQEHRTPAVGFFTLGEISWRLGLWSSACGDYASAVPKYDAAIYWYGAADEEFIEAKDWYTLAFDEFLELYWELSYPM